MGDVNFKSDRKSAAKAGSRAAIVAGLPSTEMEAMRAGSVQNFQNRTSALRDQVKTQQQGNQMQGLGNLLQLIALMRRSQQDQAQRTQLQQPMSPIWRQGVPARQNMFDDANAEPNYGYDWEAV